MKGLNKISKPVIAITCILAYCVILGLVDKLAG